MRIKCKPGVIPTAFSNDMTYYEQICKMLDKINELVDKYNAFNPGDYVKNVSTEKVVYATDSEGKNTTIKYGPEIANLNGIVQRDGQQVLVPLTPASDYHATSKNYTETTFAKSSDVAQTYATKAEVNAKYTKPSTGIPGTDIAAGTISNNNLGEDVKNTYATKTYVDTTFVKSSDASQTYATKAEVNAKYTKPASGIPGTDIAPGAISNNNLAEDVKRTYATKAEVNAKYTKPASGIPESDLSSAVVDKLNQNSVIDLGTLTLVSASEFSGTISDENYAKLSEENAIIVATLPSNMGRCSGVVSSFLNGYRSSFTFFPSSASVVTFAVTIDSNKTITAKMVEQMVIAPETGVTDPDNTDQWQSVKLDSSDGKLYTEREVPRPSSANAGKVPVVSDDGSGYELEDKPEGIPTGGTTGQVLTKDSDGNATWQSQSGGIVPVSELPTANEAEYNKHALYLYNGALNYIDSKTVVVPGTPTVETLSVTLPSGRSNTTAASVGTDCYVFGGYDGADLTQIVKFDTVSQTVTTLSVALPNARRYSSTASVNTNCYIFGAYRSGSALNTILKFDAVSQTVTTLSVRLPSIIYGTCAASVGTDCYVFGGYYAGAVRSIVKFDTVSQTVTTLSAKFTVGRYNACAASVGTDCYVFGGYDRSNYLNEIVKFDTVSQTVTTLSATLPSARQFSSAASVGTDCYVFGGSGNLNQIVKFDTITQTVTTLSATLPSARQGTSAAAVGTNCYVFGGSGSNYLNEIVKFDTGAGYSYTEYSYKTLLNKGDTTYTETENSQGGTTVSDAIVVKYENDKQTVVIA